jgi:hypothetical protein
MSKNSSNPTYKNTSFDKEEIMANHKSVINSKNGVTVIDSSSVVQVEELTICLSLYVLVRSYCIPYQVGMPSLS